MTLPPHAAAADSERTAPHENSRETRSDSADASAVSRKSDETSPQTNTVRYSRRKRARGITIHIIRAAVTMSRAPDNDVSGNRQAVASCRHEFAALI
jgi:hypothetical protein